MLLIYNSQKSKRKHDTNVNYEVNIVPFWKGKDL